MATTDMTASAVSETVEAAPHRRAAQTTAKKQNTGRSPILWIVLVIVALAFGVGMGTFLTRRHYKAKEVVASVNGKLFTKEDFFTQLQANYGTAIIKKMVADELFIEFAREKGVLPSPDEVSARLKMLNDAAKNDNAAPLGEEYKGTLMLQMARSKLFSQGVSPSDAQVRQFYKENCAATNPKALFYRPPAVQLAVIVTKTKEQGDEAVRRLNIGIAFAQVAKELSIDPSKQNSGLLAPTLKGRAALAKYPALERKFFSLKIGQQTGPDNFLDKWWIIRCVDKKPERTLSFDTVAEQCRTTIALRKGLPTNGKKMEEDFQKFKAKARVTAYWKAYENALKIE